MAFNAGDLLARIIALVPSRIGILNTLRVDDAEAGFFASPLADTGLTNTFFLTPAPAGSRLGRWLGNSTGENTHALCAL
jgi:hypothetical protein